MKRIFIVLCLLISIGMVFANEANTRAYVENVKPEIISVDATPERLTPENLRVTITVLVEDQNGIEDLRKILGYYDVRAYIAHEDDLGPDFESTRWLRNISVSEWESKNMSNSTIQLRTTIEMKITDKMGKYFVEVVAWDKHDSSGTWLDYSNPIPSFEYAEQPITVHFEARGGDVGWFRVDDIEISEVTRKPIIWSGSIIYMTQDYRNYTKSGYRGFLTLTFEGNIEMEKPLRYWWINITRTFKQPVVAYVSTTDIKDCYSLSEDRVYCDATGSAGIYSAGPCYSQLSIFGRIYTTCEMIYKSVKLDTLRFDINPKTNTMSLEGGKIWDDVFRITGMNLTLFHII